MIGRRGTAGRGGLGGTVAMVALAGAAALAWYEAPSGAPPRAAIFEIFAVTYIAIAIGRLPGLRLHRPGAALVGPRLMLAGGGAGGQHRQRRDDHRQPAEHSDRRLLAYPLRRVCRGVDAGRGGGAAGYDGADRFVLSGRVSRPHGIAAGLASPAAFARPPRDKIGAGRRADDGGVLCRSAARESGADRRRFHAADPHRTQRTHLPHTPLPLSTYVPRPFPRRPPLRTALF